MGAALILPGAAPAIRWIAAVGLSAPELLSPD